MLVVALVSCADVQLGSVGSVHRSPTVREGLEIRVLSGRADMVSGGSAFVEIRLPRGASAKALRVTAGERDVTKAFAQDAEGRTRGVVGGLVVGGNRLTATSIDGSFAGATLALTNHPIGGPILLGNQVLPWICATPLPTPATATTAATMASGLSGRATDAQCNMPVETRLFYRTRAPQSVSEGDGGCRFVLPDPSPTAADPKPPTPPHSCLQPYLAGVTPPDAIATTMPLGASGPVPYIVRLERGTLNRGIYDIAVLFDPARPWTALAPQAHWSGRTLFYFGGGTSQTRLQNRPSQNWADDKSLSRGVMFVSHSLTDSGSNSNRVLVAETVMMLKEHITKNYGEIRYAMGGGCSGGSINQNSVASIYPGLLDGLQIQCNYPDFVTGFIEASDCALLVRTYAGKPWRALMRAANLSEAQVNRKKAAINGHIDQTGCHAWSNAYGHINKPGNYVPMLVVNDAGDMAPGKPSNNCALPAALVYHRTSNPRGLRCDDPGHAVAVWGVAPGTARAVRTIDNEGVQYGLNALLAGAIRPEEFITLNEAIGGTDGDGEPMANRSVADEAALATAYQSGIVASGVQLAKLPIIDVRVFDDSMLMGAPFGFHHIYRSFSERDRIDRDVGGHANHVMWRFGNIIRREDWLAGRSAPPALALRQFLMMDAWLSALATAAPKASLNSSRNPVEVIAAKPADAVDHCYLSSDPGLTARIFDPAACNADPRLAAHASPRQVAGGPRAEDVLKCALKPLDFDDYGSVRFSTDQRRRLRALFGTGVCDYTRPGVGQQPAASPRNYIGGPGGAPLPPEPKSVPL